LKLGILFLNLFIILFSIRAHSEAKLKLVSMNVYMLPKPIKWTYQRERTEALLEQLKKLDYDVIVFQEAFIQSFRDSTSEKMKDQYPYFFYLDKPHFFSSLLGSGLLVLSRKPMKILGSVHFKDCSSFDCFASKGAVLAQIAVSQNTSVQLAITHLQAGQSSAEIRTKQLVQIRDLLNQHKQDGVVQLLAGDINIDFANSDFEKALSTVNMSYAPLNGEIKTTNARSNDCYDAPTRKLWIDHLWASDISKIKNWSIQVNDLNFQLDQKTCPLSDHHAIEANLTLL
jgi:endonuclease/exonuclease/phosphatase family metal-dependent hydrolase